MTYDILTTIDGTPVTIVNCMTRPAEPGDPEWVLVQDKVGHRHWLDARTLRVGRDALRVDTLLTGLRAQRHE